MWRLFGAHKLLPAPIISHKLTWKYARPFRTHPITTSEFVFPPLGEIPKPTHPVVLTFTTNAIVRSAVLKFQWSMYVSPSLSYRVVLKAYLLDRLPKTMGNSASRHRSDFIVAVQHCSYGDQKQMYNLWLIYTAQSVRRRLEASN